MYVGMVMEQGSHSPTEEANIKCACYGRGRSWTCPDPKDIEKVEDTEKRYSEGIFLLKEIRWITEEQYGQLKM